MHAFVTDGGYFAILIAGVVAASLPAAVFRHAMRHRTRFPGFDAGVLQMILGAGVAGTGMGMVMVVGAAEVAELGMRGDLLARGTAIALSTARYGALLAAPVVGLAALLRAATPDEVRRRVRPAIASGPVATLGLGAILIAASAVAAGFVELLAGAEFVGVQSTFSTSAAMGAIGIVAGAMNVAMGTVGGLRGLRSEPS